MILNCIAVDDEPPALDLIRRFIGQTPFLKLTESFDNAIEALSFIGKNPVDLIFLDIQMPDLSGIELARILSNRNMQDAPAIIFTTAFDQFAVEGYKLNVIDYLLKPFGYEDFVRAATKAMKFAEMTTKPEEVSSSLDDYIYLKVEFQIVKIACDNISHIEGLKDYAKIYLIDSEKPVLSLITLKAIEDKLPKEKFMRIHRSTIISLDKVTSVTKNSVSIGTGTYNVSEQYKDDFARFYITWK
ncbi:MULTISPECIES: response regulator transcription factor [unclassified Mucilaginibacter]|uniref:LytR/AlgR family response regulator transcription factor n=1 Tax=unclassified Mucilaginibacter TaxID=2617802 RepID=UPI002AC9DA08|nr:MULTISPECIES: response regulator transcription factor [unclassified Mucilaginibacter]MEB0263906.1 response regulator transcription factor [Mucilaginibacter sp. 10I4]MEB0279314.1 response regulator transcription factor [Mucilaginibacter sp. 10B2]MEB0302901.1 response regulator transcription factor [Mucilaginibacter sp. 5C4]WPX23174.1 response regulator transcription factor [Mucilaginibacter sp. 5C4]